MNRNKPFTVQLIIIGGFIVFFYIFFALATSIYKAYRLEQHIAQFESRINELAKTANQKPEDVKYFSSIEYKDQYAKENLNLLNPGERLIIIPQEEQKIKRGVSLLSMESNTPKAVLNLPNRNQWWAYFFGQTLSVEATKQDKKAVPEPPPSSPNPPKEEDQKES
jgi:cell division protein FtsB